MKNIKPHFMFTKQQRSGVFLLLVIIIILQLVYFYMPIKNFEQSTEEQLKIAKFQKEIDSLSEIKRDKKHKIKPYNPNFITDYKGYVLGMSVDEIDRLHRYRKTNQFVNSAKEFQKITQVSDSLLKKLAPKFKFPDWVGQKKNSNKKVIYAYSKEINKTTAKDILKQTKVNYKLCYRIINFRDNLGGFQNWEQLLDVYQVTTDDIQMIKEKFHLNSIPKIQKISLNLATVAELSKNAYINEYLAINIVEERVLRDGFTKLSELKFVKHFPVDKYDRIKLYFTVK